MLKYFFTALAVFYSPLVRGSEPAKNSWMSLGGEFNSFSIDGEEKRKAVSALNLNLNVSQRVHSDLWLGINAFLGHDPSPTISRNYDQSLGFSAHWFPLSLSSDSSLYHEGLQLTELETLRPFLSSQLMVGRILLRRSLKNFDASSDYLGLALGTGSQYALSAAFSLSVSLNYQKNIGLGQIEYDGSKFSLAASVVWLN